MIYTLPDLPYDYSALEPYCSAETLELHHGKHHRAYVDGANRVLERLEGARAQGDYGDIVGLEKSLAFNVSGHVLHTLFWANLAPGGSEQDASDDLRAAISDAFGSFDGFRRQLEQATVTVQGSGWGSLSWEPTGQRLLVEQIYDHEGNASRGAIPLLVFDAWEHAYYLQYRNARADYVSALWNVVCWEEVERRLAAARSIITVAA